MNLIKNILGILAVLFLISYALWQGFLWYAMAEATADIAGGNGRLWQQQFYLTQGQMTLEYDEVDITLRHFLPAARMTAPRVTVATPEGSYTLSASHLDFVSGFRSFREMKILLPETLMLKHQGEEKALKITSLPVTLVRTTEDTGKTIPAEINFTEFRLKDETPLTLEVPITLAGNTKTATLNFQPPLPLYRKWQPLRYEVYPYLTHFFRRIENLSPAHAPRSKI